MEVVADSSAGPEPGEAPSPSATGDHDVLAGVYRDKAGALRRVARAVTCDPGVADDLVQEAFIRTLRARGAPSRPDELFFYLVRVVLNLTRSHAAKAARRAARRSPHRAPDDATGPRDGEDAPGPLTEAVARLPRRQRDVVLLRYWLDLSVDDTARLMGISAGSVKTHASRALDTLRADLPALTGDDHDEH